MSLRKFSSILSVTLIALAGCQRDDATSAKKEEPNPIFEKYFEKGPVKMTVQIAPKEPRLSDLMTLDVIVEAAPGVDVKAPAFGQSVGEFIIRDYREISDGNAAADKAAPKRRFHYQLEPTHAG